MPREAVPVGSGQAGCWLEALRVLRELTPPTTHPPSTHTHTDMRAHTHRCTRVRADTESTGLAWDESGTGRRDMDVTGLSRGTSRAGGSPPPLGTGDVAQLHKERFFDAWKEQKKKAIIFSSQVEPKKKKGVMVFFGIVLVVEQMHFAYPKRSGLLVEVRGRQKP